MPTYKAVIAYDGSAFSGFALQKHRPSVLEALQKAFLKVGIESPIIGASRTDKGVHATAQVISFKACHLDSKNTQLLRDLLNTKLYPHIKLRSLCKIHDDFHPRFEALWRAYRFIFYTNPSVFCSSYVSCEKIGNIKLLKSALKAFEGEHNFMYFKKNGSYTKSDIRTIFACKHYTYKGANIIYIRANGFLRAQVRLMVGAALCVSRGELELKALKEQLSLKAKHYTYPISPNGLYLCGVGYAFS
ncbi:tRNA pseudouridine(38-40) synthase TruA [Helicobacter jaachi]|uniref:tRNA pseudouridine synthase A n=1 Tax=Helicobacter jaachi TaxID=1677920 RepID=A0A4U8TAC1_9HELI|nr:tRNA pseudouridine(38-40) synthase TruA [Helicobacter jaachi]TLD96830.1 tRNA pseudouridine(38-40) synthase TruA [Helicobacter jaachi]